MLFISSASDLNQHWEVSASLTPPLQRHLNGTNRPKSNPQDSLEPNFLSIEEAFDRAMSLPSSPVVKSAEDSFDSYDENEGNKKPRSASEKTKRDSRDKTTASPSSSLGMGRKHFLDGFKRRARTKSGDDLNEERGLTGLASRLEGSDFPVNISDSDEKLHLSSPIRRYSESTANQARQVFNHTLNMKK